MRAIFIPFNLADSVSAWDTYFGSEPELVEEVFVSQIQRGIDARKMFEPAHYFVGENGAQISLDDVFTIRQNVAPFKHDKSPVHSLMLDVKEPSLMALITHFAHDEIGNGTVTIVLPDAVFFKHNDIHSITKTGIISRPVDHRLEPVGAHLNNDQISFRSVGELLIFDNFLQDIGQGMTGLDEEARGDFDQEVQTVIVVTPSINDGEVTHSDFEVRFLEHSIEVTGPSSTTTKKNDDKTDIPNGAAILKHGDFGSVGKVTLESGKELCPMSGLAKASKAIEETTTDGSEAKDGGQTTQQSNELY